MPCLILTGHPSVGKTTLASILKERALQHSSGRIQSVLIINEELACPGLSKNKCYLNSHNEKKTRGALKARFDQAIVGNKADLQHQLVILDSLNYIKGFRYELHCISKSAGEQHGVIWVLNSSEVAQQWNQKRNEQAAESSEKNQHSVYYNERTMEELILRFEPPDERNRWDKPLYKVDMRPQELKQKEQQQHNEGEILEKSVYNMHALSDVMGTTGGTTTSETTTPEAPKKKKTFKGFKRASKTAKPVQATIVSGTPTPAATSDTPFQNTGNAEAAVLYPKDFLFSSQPSEQPVPDASSTENHNVPAEDEEEERHHNNHNPRRPKKAPPPPPPPKPDPMTSIEAQVDAILDAFLLHVKPLQEGTSTRPHVAVSANALHQMDAITNAVCNSIVQQQTTMVGIIPIVLSSSEDSLFLDTKQRRLPLAELKRLRRQYLRWVTTHPPEDCDTEYGIAKSFVTYIEAQL